MSDNTFKTQSITTKDSTKFSLSLLSLSLLAALSISNPAYADCTQDNSDPNKTVFHCEGEVSESTIDKIDDITGNVTIYNTGHINGFEPAPQTDQNTEIIAGSGSKLSGNFYFGGGSDTLTLSGADISDLTMLDADYQNAHFIDGTETLNINQDITGGNNTKGKGTIIDGWDIINIGMDAKARVNLTSFISGFSVKPTNKIHIGRQGTLAIDSSNSSSYLFSYRNIINEGTIDLSNAQEHELDEYKLMIYGNYEGKPGSKIIVKSLWARDDASKNLKASLIILGRATGESEIVL